MEINNHFTHLPRKDLTQSSPVLGLQEEELGSQLMMLKHAHVRQQELLLQQFQEQQLRLAEVQEKQVQEHIKLSLMSTQMLMLQRQQEYLEQQKKLEEQQRREKERQEKQRIEQIKNKKKDEESAVASSEVKLKLQEFVLNKKQREAVGSLGNSPPHLRHWAQHRSLDQHSPPTAGLSPPYRPRHLLGQYDTDFPLRKTVSDSNLKVRSKLKEKVVQRSSPLLRRKDFPGKRKTPLTIDTTHDSPDSGPNTPPSGSHSIQGEVSSALQEEGVGPFPLQMMTKMVTNQSMPNISIGQTRDSASSSKSTDPSGAGTASEAEIRARATIQYGLPLTPHMLPSTLPFYPSLPVIDSEFSPPTSPAYIASQMKVLEQTQAQTPVQACGATKMASSMPYAIATCNNVSPMTEAQMAAVRLQRRQLHRTHSAPLPLGHPLLNQPALLIQQKEQLLKENQKLYLRQRLQSTVLSRSGSKNHMENVDEETEARLAQEMKEVREREDDDVVIIKDSEDSITSAYDLQQKNREAFLAQQREVFATRQRTISGGSPPMAGVPPRPLARAQSSPSVTIGNVSPQGAATPEAAPKTFTTGLAYDTLMLKHNCTCGNNANHPEHPGRIHSIWARLQETGHINKCERIKCRKATIEELQTCHGEAYTLLYGCNPINRQKLDPKLLENLPSRFCVLPCGGMSVDSDTVWNDLYTSAAARMATGSVIELAFKVALEELKNGMAIVRPPGHHAESNQAMGFCFFNNIAVATKQLKEKLKLEKILIVDWDVHHGNSTQQIFYDDPQVLYMSLHRHDNGNFFPGTGAPDECGSGLGAGFNVNLPWAGSLNPAMGDAEYIAAFRTLIMPIAREFKPDIVLVSAGFDAACGHPPPLGGYQVSSACFAFMTKQMMTLAGGKVVLVLEGGYDLPAICDAAEVCVKALLGEEVPVLRKEEISRRPCDIAVKAMETSFKYQTPHWTCLRKFVGTLGYSAIEAQQHERDEADTVSAFASLSVVQENSPSNSIDRPGATSRETSEPMEES